MSQKFLPPLEVGQTYRTRDFEYLEFEAQGFHRQLTGEDAAILRLLLANSTKLEIPLSDEDLKHHLRLLMEAYPRHALDYAKTRWPKEFEPK